MLNSITITPTGSIILAFGNQADLEEVCGKLSNTLPLPAYAKLRQGKAGELPTLTIRAQDIQSPLTISTGGEPMESLPSNNLKSNPPFPQQGTIEYREPETTGIIGKAVKVEPK